MTDTPAAAFGAAMGGEAVSGSTVLSGSAWNLTTRVVPQLYLLAVSVAAARFLGPDNLGRQSFIAFAELSVMLTFSAGVPAALMRYMGEMIGRRRSADARALVGWAWRVEAVLAVLGGGGLVVAGLWRPGLRSAWLLAAIAATMGILSSVPRAVLAGMQRWREGSIITLVTGLAGTLCTLAVLAAGGGIVGMFAVDAVVAAISLAWVAGLARKAASGLKAGQPLEGPLRGDVIRYAAAVSVQLVLHVVVWRRSEFLFLDRYSNDAEISFYSIAYSATTAIVSLVGGLAAVLAPAVATLHGAGEIERVRVGYGRASRLVTMAALPITALAIAVGPSTLRVVFGAQYERAGPVAVVMLSIFPLVALHSLGGSLLQGLGRLRLILSAYGVATVVNLALDLLLIPPHGAVGAACANAAGQLTGSILILLAVRRCLGPTGWAAGRTMWTLPAAALSGASAWAVVHALDGITGLLVGGCAGAAAFVLAVAALKPLSRQDAAWLEGATHGSVGALVKRMTHVVSPNRSG